MYVNYSFLWYQQITTEEVVLEKYQDLFILISETLALYPCFIKLQIIDLQDNVKDHFGIL